MTRAVTDRCRIFLLFWTAALVGACATSPPTPNVDFKADYDFSGIQKIAFYHHSGMVSGNNPIPLSDMQRERIDSALATALGNKGYQILDQKDADQAQLLISWNLITSEKTDVRTYQTPGVGMGYARFGGYNRYSMYNCWGCPQTEVSVRNYTEGTFILDLIDPKLQRSVWRSLVQSRLKGKPEHDQDKYDAAAANILASFPPP